MSSPAVYAQKKLVASAPNTQYSHTRPSFLAFFLFLSESSCRGHPSNYHPNRTIRCLSVRSFFLCYDCHYRPSVRYRCIQSTVNTFPNRVFFNLCFAHLFPIHAVDYDIVQILGQFALQLGSHYLCVPGSYYSSESKSNQRSLLL